MPETPHRPDEFEHEYSREHDDEAEERAQLEAEALLEMATFSGAYEAQVELTVRKLDPKHTARVEQFLQRQRPLGDYFDTTEL